jgi:hypothetical protein
VWPRDRAAGAEWLRVGRRSVERWKNFGGTCSLVAEHAMPHEAAPNAQHLNEAIALLYRDAPSAPVTLILESAWVPVMLVDTGRTLLRAAQVEALVRHRFGLYFVDGIDPVATWELRIEQRAGHPQALAYGMPPRLKRTLTDAGGVAGLRWAAMTPAFAWGCERLPTKRFSRASRWFVWGEQDRTLLARMAQHGVSSLNAGAERVASATEVLRLVDAERMRRGVEATTDRIAVSTWGAAPLCAGSDERIDWLDLCGKGGVSTGLAPSANGAKVAKVAS